MFVLPRVLSNLNFSLHLDTLLRVHFVLRAQFVPVYVEQMVAKRCGDHVGSFGRLIRMIGLHQQGTNR